MFVKIRSIQKPGMTIIELLVYVSLLSMLVTIIFSFVWQIYLKNNKVFRSHANLHVAQMAVDLLSRDLRASSKIKSESRKLLCYNKQGLVTWNLDKTGTLFRLEQLEKNAKTKKAIPAKVLEGLIKFSIKPLRLSSTTLIKLKLIDKHKQIFKKNLLMRAGLIL